MDELTTCLRTLDSSKATERKKNVLKLEELLQTDKVITALDASSDRRTEERNITWDTVFKAVNRYIEVEVAALQSAKESVSAITLNNRDKKKQGLAAAFRLVIKTANCRDAVRLRLDLIIDRVLSILKDRYILVAVGTDFSNVLLKLVLQVRQYWLELQPGQWKQLLFLYLKIYFEQLLDPVIVSRILQELINGSILQGRLYPRKLFSFFNKVFESIRELNSSVIESMLISLNLFCLHVAPSCRVQLCHFGESLRNSFIYLWSHSNHEKIREELISFLHLLLRAHHPCGVSDQTDGAYAYNWDHWKAFIDSLYELIHTDIEEKSKFTTGNKINALKSNYVSFVADLFKQVPLHKAVLCDTLNQSLSSYTSDTATQAKRQRLSTENKSLLQALKDTANTVHVVPWLQILNCLLLEYPEYFGSEGLSAVLHLMASLLAECKRGQLFHYLFDVLTALVKAFPRKEEVSAEDAAAMTTIWSYCLSTINSRQASVEGYQEAGLSAMSCLLDTQIVKPAQEIWNLFLLDYMLLSSPAADLLTSLVVSVGIPENYIPSIIGAGVQKQTYPLRRALIAWMLPGISFETSPAKSSLPPSRVAEILFSLTLKDPSAVLEQQRHNARVTSVRPDFELIYLKNTFNQSFKTSDRGDNFTYAKITHNNPQISTTAYYLVSHLSSLSNSLDTVQSSTDYLAWLACICVKLLSHFGPTNKLSGEIKKSLEKVLKKWSSVFMAQVVKDGIKGQCGPLRDFCSLFTIENLTLQDESIDCTLEFLQSCFSQEFINTLVNLVLKKSYRENKSDLSTTGFKRRKRRYAQFEDEEEENLAVMKQDDFDFEMSRSTQNRVKMEVDTRTRESDETMTNTNVSNLSYLSRDHLNESQLGPVLCVELLSILGANYRGGVLPEGSAQIKGKLLNLIGSESFDPKSPVHLHFLLTVTKYLLILPYHVTCENMKTILSVYRLTAKALSLDLQICTRLVSHLSNLVPHLSGHPGDKTVSEELLFCRDTYFKFISDFWRLSEQSNSDLKFELVKTMVQLIKNDPGCTWGKLKVESEEEEDGSKSFELVTVGQHLIKALAEDCAFIKNFVAEEVKWLFVQKNGSGIDVALNETTQQSAFDRIFIQCSDLMDLQETEVNTLNVTDELKVCQATCLQVFSTILTNSPLCEKKCLLGLCQLISYRHIPLDLVFKMLNLACRAVSYPDVRTYVEYQLPYLVHNWLNEGVVNSSVQQFPFQLLNFTCVEQFVRAHQDLIVTETLINKMKLDEVARILKLVGIDLHPGLLSALPHILIYILPLFAADCAKQTLVEPVSHKLLKKATDCYEILKLELSDKEINESVVENLEAIIMRVLNCLYLDNNEFSGSLLSFEPNPPFYNGEIVRTTLDYLAQNFIVENKEKTTLINVLVKSPDGISQVLLSLSTLLWRAHQPYDQVRYLKMYGLFVNIVLVDLADGLGDGWASFIRDVLNRILIILGDSGDTQCVSSPSYEEEKILTALDILYNLCKEALIICPDEMANYIHLIVDTAAGNACRSPAICLKVSQLIEAILTVPFKDSVELVKAIELLNPLPDVQGLEEANCKMSSVKKEAASLLEMFEQLLLVHQVLFYSPSQGLANRLNQLTISILAKQQQLYSLSTSQTGLNCLKKVVSVLVKLMSSSCKKVVSASASCLGAIGPIDLQCWSLSQPREPSYAAAFDYYKGEDYEKYCWLLHALDYCLLDENIEIVKTAGQILQTVLATKSGIQFEADYKKTMQDKSFLFHYLHAYRCSNKKIKDAPGAVKGNVATVDNVSLWMGEDLSHDVWIKQLTACLLMSGLVQCELLNKIHPICALKSQFCEEGLPYLIHDILQHGDEDVRLTLSRQMSNFFQAFCQSVKHVSVSGTDPVWRKKESLMTFINVIQYLRQRKRLNGRNEAEQTAWDNNFWLDINYLDIAQAALFCGAYFSTILFAEIWWDVKINAVSVDSDGSTSLSSQETSLDPLSLASTQEEKGPELQSLLLQAYTKIGDPDGIYGCGAGRRAEPLARVESYLHEGQQSKALTTLDIEISHNPAQLITPLLQAIQSCGADYILRQCLSGLRGDADTSSLSDEAFQLREFHYQAAWKLGQWDTLPSARINKATPFHQCLYQALQCFHEDHLVSAKDLVDLTRMNVIERFEPQVESCQAFYPFLSQLQCLVQMECLIENSSRPEEMSLFVDIDSGSTGVPSHQFHYKEPLLSLCSTMGKLMSASGTASGQDLAVKSLWCMAVSGRKAKQFQLAEKAIRELKSLDLSKSTVTSPEEIQLEEAKLFWARSEVNIALSIMKNLINRHLTSENRENSSIYAKALGTYGNWLAETKSETPAVIINDYLEKTVSLLLKPIDGSGGYDRSALNSFISLARFADEQYQQVADYMRSPTFIEKKDLLERTKRELRECKDFKLGDCQEFKKSKYLNLIEKNIFIDQQEINSLVLDREKFLKQALINYLRCLQWGDLHNVRVFRVVSLWFENHGNDPINELIKSCLARIKTFKFLPLYYQLAARMTSADSTLFQQVLMQLMQKVAEDHPHHALWVIMALAHANKDDEMLQGETTGRGRSNKLSRNVQEHTEESRVEAAKLLLEKLKKNAKVSAIVKNMEFLCLAYIQLANTPATNKMGQLPIPKSLNILKLPKMDNVLMPSVELKVDPSGMYSNLVSPLKFEPTYSIVGGINLPKVIVCHGSDGRPRTQLVKGQDDLRQDAVMQQVFSLVNQLLASAPETQERKLNVRTYKVVPLSQKCGLLQWCEGTQPLGEYLIKPNNPIGAHARYRPKDWLAKDCRSHLHIAGSSAEKRFKAYQEICAHFKPVFRYFFMESFPEPSVWFEKRLAYTRSVATNSIVGYILGLGDRHVMNILVDLKSAELIHIDLGIAFDMGHILPTPETVPFRLTRDIVDGMGITGVEGTFRRCCEHTMQVMKDNSESLLTIVQVLMHDPLSHWTLTPQQALTIQRKRDEANVDNVDLPIASGQVPSSGQVAGAVSDTDTNIRNIDPKTNKNKLAERTLLRLKQKLNGQEGNAQLSISGQVNYLIQKASDPRNLCKLFAGWQPYL
ncbi:serine-protein kinase ATM-like isoform X2 [Biomphalaria glabrata]|uniref:non-specific serine/threonine protein kinase n=1 Tax=Biomphalaria glabrata TaxID=6526 RepID=A0A9W3AMJ3_BIOGL|nr:serine-protein kinase ATM-like isoform X2 [Biomphalaria glabrata]